MVAARVVSRGRSGQNRDGLACNGLTISLPLGTLVDHFELVTLVSTLDCRALIRLMSGSSVLGLCIVAFIRPWR